MKLIMRLAVNVVALLVVAYVIPGFIISDLLTAIVTAIVMGAINTFIRPFVHLLALPISLMTFGIFAFFINVAFLWVISMIVPGFTIVDFSTAIVASILLTLVSWFLHSLARE
jgi:putative membrane protein